MSLDKESVEHLARLARLEVADAVFDETVDKLSKVVEFVDQLSKVDTAGVVPMAHPTHAVQRLRPDEVTYINDRDAIQQNAASVEGGLYLVPKVIE
jgi:aspartyl-tRNA(Asn)/glutamyl-tRNA(Gln) amidotransferase subunit C